jgi:hypothetical protein
MRKPVRGVQAKAGMVKGKQSDLGGVRPENCGLKGMSVGRKINQQMSQHDGTDGKLRIGMNGSSDE